MKNKSNRKKPLQVEKLIVEIPMEINVSWPNIRPIHFRALLFICNSQKFVSYGPIPIFDNNFPIDIVVHVKTSDFLFLSCFSFEALFLLKQYPFGYAFTCFINI